MSTESLLKWKAVIAVSGMIILDSQWAVLIGKQIRMLCGCISVPCKTCEIYAALPGWFGIYGNPALSAMWYQYSGTNHLLHSLEFLRRVVQLKRFIDYLDICNIYLSCVFFKKDYLKIYRDNFFNCLKDFRTWGRVMTLSLLCVKLPPTSKSYLCFLKIYIILTFLLFFLFIWINAFIP